jgi:hypothetical protein
LRQHGLRQQTDYAIAEVHTLPKGEKDLDTYLGYQDEHCNLEEGDPTRILIHAA